MPTASVIEYIRRVAGPTGTDASLLDRFVRQGDEAAFAEIVQRHGPTVWGVCTRALSRSHDAEDAYQATFLVLAGKASSLRRPGALANWLFGVARRTCLEVRKRRARIREEPAIDVAAPEPASTDLQDALDEEIARLPERFRVPIVLCYLEGRSNAEAAEMLSCPEGTVVSRLSTARNRLHARLTRRGLAPILGGLAVVLTESGASAMPPVAATASSTSLAQGVLTAMFLAKAKSVVIAALCVAVLGIAGFAWLQVTAQSLAPPTVAADAKPSAPRPSDPKPSDLKPSDLKPSDLKPSDLGTKRRDVARAEYDLRRKAFAEGWIVEATSLPAGGNSGSFPVVLDHRLKDVSAATDRGKLLESSQRLLRAELDLAADGAGRRTAYAAQIERLTSIEAIVRERVRAGTLPHVAELEIESIRLETEARAQQER